MRELSDKSNLLLIRITIMLLKYSNPPIKIKRANIMIVSINSVISLPDGNTRS